MIAVFLNQDLKLAGANNGLWYEGNEEYAAFRWKVKLETENDEIPLDFTAVLYPDGNIEYYYQDFGNPDDYRRITGISLGDGINYELAEFTNNVPVESQQVVSFTPKNFPSDLAIDNDGFLTAESLAGSKIYEIAVGAKDNNEISDIKSFQLSSGIIYNYIINSGDDDRIECGEVAHLNFDIKNISTQSIDGLDLYLQISDPFITMVDSTENVGTINPGQTINVSDIFSFSVANDVPDNYNLDFDVYLLAESDNWLGKLSLKAFAPVLVLGNPIIDDGDNNRLDPGETTDIILTINNYGHSRADEVVIEIDDSDQYLTLNSNPIVYFGDIPGGGNTSQTINLTVDANTPEGFISSLEVKINAAPNYEIYDTLRFLIGRYALAIIDLDPDQFTGPVVDSLLNVLSVYHEYYQLIPSNMELYRSLFVFLGRKFSNHILTEEEALFLKDFIDSGGYMYLEGGETWGIDPETSLHQMFGVEAQPVTWHIYDSISGNIGTFTEGMLFHYSSEMMYYNHYLVPAQQPAFTILEDPVDDHNFMVAREKYGIKTIASKFDFAALIDSIHPSTKKELLTRILDFFEIGYIYTSTSEPQQSPSDLELTCFPNPASSITNISFSLQESAKVDLTLYNVFGMPVKNILNSRFFEKGDHTIHVNFDYLEVGIYICVLKTKATKSSIKLVLVN